MASDAPRVFISHAHQDKQRFVIPFATALVARGIDAWVDQWEMLVGDSLVDKIFEEGLKQADAMVVVLSEHSVHSKWVREELNAGFVARIQKGTRLIPILIDHVDVPEALKSTLWVDACHPEDFNTVVSKVVNAVFEHRSRPPLGPKPGFAEVAPIHGLQASDTLVLKAFGDHTLAHRDVALINTETVCHDVESQGISRDSYLESLGVLENGTYLEPSKLLTHPPQSFKLTSHGMEQYLLHFFDAYPAAIRALAADLVNNKPSNLTEALSRLTIPQAVARHILRQFEQRGSIRTATTVDGTVHITSIQPQLRRIL